MRMFVKQIFLKYKKLVIFLLIYLVFFSVVLYFFKYGGSPRDDDEIYKGIVQGDQTGFSGLTILFSATSLKEAGVNLVVAEVPFFVDNKGNIREFPYYRQLLIHNIEAAHRNGLQYCITLQETFISGHPGQMTIPDEVWSNFFIQWNRLVLEYAALAERHGVELFAPWVEGDAAIGFGILLNENSLRGFEKASDWGQEILHEIRKVYSGDVLWRTAITFGGYTEEKGRWETYRDNIYFNFTGYDYIGFTIFPSYIGSSWSYGDPVAEERYRDFMEEVIDHLLMLAERDGCKGVIATEFGEERVFEAGEGKLSGYFYWFDQPELISYWYKERLP